MDKRKLLGILVLAGAGFWWWRSRAAAPGAAGALPGASAGSGALPLITGGISIPAGQLPLGVPAGSLLVGYYYTSANAKNYEGAFYKAPDGTYYDAHRNTGKVSHIKAKTAANYINSPLFKAAH